MKKIGTTPSSIYLMHKYWGKKPSNELKEQVIKYTKKGDTILDPFAGYGGIGIEAVLENRNVILNDLNPSANFISNCILDTNININIVKDYFKIVSSKYKNFENEFYSFKGNEIITILRKKDNTPIKIKINQNGKLVDLDLTEKESNEMLNYENSYKISDWYPSDKIIQNSRICSNGKMKINDLFTKRSLASHARLYKLIMDLPATPEREMMLFAFTSNLANCSKLVPPILSRGPMSQGAWMTGFYIGDTYLENNVFHYFENRVKKIIKGKTDFLNLYGKKNSKYTITCEDAKKLSLKSESIDFVFTDFPYGDTVPYFEQSQIWNSWLKKKVDYENEIVVSDSKERNKSQENFAKDINDSISEICRVLKCGKYFTFTFHSLNGDEWEAITNSLINNAFSFVDCKFLIQKTFTPRQLNRKMSIKGDLIVTYKKVKVKQIELDYPNVKEKIAYEIEQQCEIGKLYDTNDLIILCVKCLLKYNQIANKVDFIELIKEYFEIKDNKWILKE